MRLRSLRFSCIAILLLVGLASTATLADAESTGIQKTPATVTAQDGFLFRAAGGVLANPGEQSTSTARNQDDYYACLVTATCSGGGTVTCAGPEGTCVAVNYCYAACGNSVVWCPNPGYFCPTP